ncbi:hypothetical protein ABID92_002043 [Frigoribacterium sp. PvP120]|jgi:hypothetical protein|uniref:hypothetical protein n=1 Tax=unclassified Frigoribacterium TaxID=2627005 RepID=UPI001AE8EC6B|nr:hypothetical protein [Frigoribacterium sp. PvP121]MBP1240345.1 hypothetical protein [Frigoribacterium sp. PvP121]
MTKSKQATGIGVAAAVTVGLVFGGGSPVSASTTQAEIEGQTMAPLTAEVTAGSLEPQEGSVPDEKQARVAVVPIITAVILAGGAVYAMGEKAGERSYHAGLRRAGWQNVKWQARATALSMLGPVGGTVFITGFENKFYSMA